MGSHWPGPDTMVAQAWFEVLCRLVLHPGYVCWQMSALKFAGRFMRVRISCHLGSVAVWAPCGPRSCLAITLCYDSKWLAPTVSWLLGMGGRQGLTTHDTSRRSLLSCGPWTPKRAWGRAFCSAGRAARCHSCLLRTSKTHCPVTLLCVRSPRPHSSEPTGSP